LQGVMNFFNELENYSDNPAVISGLGDSLSYTELAAAGDDIGKQVGERCLVFSVCRNLPESLAGYLGFLRGRVVPFLVNDTIEKFLFANLMDAYKPKFVYLPAKNSDLIPNGEAVYSHDRYVLFRTDYHIDYELHEDLALLLSTSGSTGSPKLVRQSYKNIVSNAEAIAQYLEISCADRPITTMPMNYTYGLSILNSHLLRGASIILNEATLLDNEFWHTLKKERATTFGGVPYLYEILKKLRFGKMDLPSLQYLTQAGGKLSPELCAEFGKICADKGISKARQWQCA